MFDINNINLNDNNEFIIGLDYDGVITKRGSSGENEEKWLKRENNILWRKLLNVISTVYNRYFSLNEEIIELTKILKTLNCKIIVISSHTLTTTDYKESLQTRNRVINRLKRKNIIFDDVIFIAGDKVDICQKLGVNLMLEDNLDKVDALRKGGIQTIAKKTNKNFQLLENENKTVDNLMDFIPYVVDEMMKLKHNINYIDNDSLEPSIQDTVEIKKKTLFANFSEFAEELIYEESLNINNTFDQPLTLKKTRKDYYDRRN